MTNLKAGKDKEDTDRQEHMKRMFNILIIREMQTY